MLTAVASPEPGREHTPDYKRGYLAALRDMRRKIIQIETRGSPFMLTDALNVLRAAIEERM